MNKEQENKIHKFNNVMFQKLEEYDLESTDTRFIKTKIWVMNLGSNFNGSYFSREVVEKAIPSLSNTPILCYIEPNKEGDIDFSDHRYEVEKNSENEYIYSCKEMAIGVIPENNGAHFEDRLCDDGIVRTYLVVENALIWTKWNTPIDIFSHQQIKSQSMEITDIDGEINESDGLFYFSKFNFFGCTILGNDFSPACPMASIEVNFSTENNKLVSKEIENKLNEFAKYFSKKEEEIESMAKKEIEEKIEQANVEVEAPVAENFAKENKSEDKSKENFDSNNEDDDTEADQSITDAIKNVAEVLDEIEDAIDGGSDEDEENEDFACNKDKEDMSMDDEHDHNHDDMPMDDSDMKETHEDMPKEDDSKKQYTLTFSLSHEDIRSQLCDKLYDMENIENTCYCIVKTMDNYFVYVDFCSGQFFEQSYIQTDDVISFVGERKEVFNILVDKETKDAMTAMTYSKLQEDLDEANAKIQEYSKANEELLKFQLDIKEKERKAEIDKVISSFSKINELDLEKYKQKAYKKELTKEELEVKLYAELGRMNFSKITGEKVEDEIEAPTNYSVSLQDQDKCPYEGCEDLFI